MLYAQAEDAENMQLPIDALYNLPYLSIYIEAPNLDENSHGFFVHFEHDVSERNSRMELRFLTVYQDCSVKAHVIHMLQNESLYTCMYEMVREGLYQASKLGEGSLLPVEVLDEVTKLKLHLVSKMLQLVLYICAENAEIKQDEVQNKIWKRPNSPKSIKDKFWEVEKLNCGETISQQIRLLEAHPNYVYYNSINKNEKSGTPKTPHVRRGHWHPFWTGSEKEGNRELVLKWQPPLLVNEEKTKDLMKIVTINKIKP